MGGGGGCHRHPETKTCGNGNQAHSLVPKREGVKGDRGSPAKGASSGGSVPELASAVRPGWPLISNTGVIINLGLFLAKELDISSYFPV